MVFYNITETKCRNGVRLLGDTSNETRETITEETVLALPAVLAATRLVSSKMAMVDCNVYRKTSKGREVVEDHEASHLLSLKPNAWQTVFSLKQAWILSTLLHGDGYIVCNREPLTGKLISLHNVPAWEIGIVDVLKRDGMVEDVVYFVNGVPVPSADVCHLRNISTGHGYSSYSLIDNLRKIWSLQIQTYTFAQRYFEHGTHIFRFVKIPPGTNDQQVAEMKEALLEYTSSKNVACSPKAEPGGMRVSTVQRGRGETRCQ